MPLSFTLKSGKVYVGVVTVLNEPRHRDYVCLLPMMSGYRNADTQEVTFTNYYTSVYENLSKKEQVEANSEYNPLKEFELQLTVAEIVSVNKFAFGYYSLFQGKV